MFLSNRVKLGYIRNHKYSNTQQGHRLFLKKYFKINLTAKTGAFGYYKIKYFFIIFELDFRINFSFHSSWELMLNGN